MKTSATVRINENTLKKLILYATLYGFLRNQTEESVDDLSPSAPYVVQGTTGNWLYGVKLDEYISSEIGDITAETLDEVMHDMIETDYLGNPL